MRSRTARGPLGPSLVEAGQGGPPRVSPAPDAPDLSTSARRVTRCATGSGQGHRMRPAVLLAVLSVVLGALGPAAGAVVPPPGTGRPAGLAAPAPRPGAAGTIPASSVPAPSVAAPPAPAPVSGGWSSPVGPPDRVPPVRRAFEAPAGPYAAGHRGVDLAAGTGTAVRAPTAGVVVFAGMVAGRPVLTLSHAGGLRSTYEPVRALVRRGDTVVARQVIGTLMGAPSHCMPQACLHWGVYAPPRDYRDPMSLLGRRGPPVLLPVPRSLRAGSG